MVLILGLVSHQDQLRARHDTSLPTLTVQAFSVRARLRAYASVDRLTARGCYWLARRVVELLDLLSDSGTALDESIILIVGKPARILRSFVAVAQLLLHSIIVHASRCGCVIQSRNFAFHANHHGRVPLRRAVLVSVFSPGEVHSLACDYAEVWGRPSRAIAPSVRLRGESCASRVEACLPPVRSDRPFRS